MNFYWSFILISFVSFTTPKSLVTNINGSTRIIGGTAAKVGEFKGQVSLQTYNKFHTCAGSLINPNHVVTAGHCFQDSRPIAYIMGDDLTIGWKGSETRQVRAILNFVQHPDYNDDTNENDIAVIRLEEPFEISERFGPMPLAKFSPSEGTKCQVVGWGKTSNEESGDLSYDLLKANVEVVDNEFCNILYENLLKPMMFCAGNLKTGNRDACDGDSGGLLSCGDEKQISGVVSFGMDCGLPEYPGVYTNVCMFEEWINHIVAQKKLPDYEYSPVRPKPNQTESSFDYIRDHISFFNSDNNAATKTNVTIIYLFIFVFSLSTSFL